jgi:predicted dehydrogenase
MGRIRVGIIGAGTIAQVEHVPNLLRLADKFKVSGICDPSATTRAFMAQNHGIDAFATIGELFDRKIDAVVIASPDPLHKEHALAALERGLHVFCEKPLCYSSGDIAELVRARDASKRVLQVGYMKRFDPAYEALLAHLPKSPEKLRHVSVEVVDADAWPFVTHHMTHRADDIPSALQDEARRKQKEQVLRGLGIQLEGPAYRGFVSAYCSSLVHDVNAVHGILDVLGVADGNVTGANLFASGSGGHGSVSLIAGQALWTMSHLSIANLPYYSERISLHFDDRDFELVFPSPYLNHQPTRLIIRRGEHERLITEQVHAGYKEAFVEELIGFWSAIIEGTAVRNTAEHAARDMALLCNLAKWQVTSNPGAIS